MSSQPLRTGLEGAEVIEYRRLPAAQYQPVCCGDVACTCARCTRHGIRWPRSHVGIAPRWIMLKGLPWLSGWMSYECHVEHTPVSGAGSASAAALQWLRDMRAAGVEFKVINDQAARARLGDPDGEHALELRLRKEIRRLKDLQRWLRSKGKSGAEQTRAVLKYFAIVERYREKREIDRDRALEAAFPGWLRKGGQNDDAQVQQTQSAEAGL